MVSRSSHLTLGEMQMLIISTVKNPISTKELLARLLRLADILSAVDQNTVSPDSYNQIAHDLANKKLLKHQNIGVQAFACCAIADILRIYAPDAPYTPEELSSIFTAFFNQFSHLWDEGNAFFLQQSYLLKRLVEVRSIILVADLPDSLRLISSLFKTMYQLASKGFPAKLEPIAADMLSEVIAEAESIPQDVVSLILKRLTVPSQSGLTGSLSNISNSGFAFSLAVCEVNVDKLSRLVAQLFSEMLDESATSTESGEVNYEASYKTLEKIHTWSVQIWRNAPDLLGSVMGLINDELNSDSEKIRILATSTIGEMIASSSMGFVESNVAHFINKHRNTWNSWLKKNSDSSYAVRAKWAEQVSFVICSPSVTSDMANELCNGLTKCLRDTHEKVRLDACKAVEKLPFHVFTSRVCNHEVLTILLQLVREKNTDVRNKAIKLTSNIYDEYSKQAAKDEITDFGNLNSEEITALGRIILHDIPNTLLKLNYINDKSVNISVDIALFEHLIPFENNALSRADRLCNFYEVLDEKSKAVFLATITRQTKFSEAFHQFVKISEQLTSLKLDDENTEESLLQKLDKIITWLTVSLPPTLNTVDCLESFIHLKNARFNNLLANCVLPDSDYKTVKNSLKELLTSLGDPKILRISDDRLPVSTTDMIANMKILLYRASNIFCNKSNVSELLKLSCEPQNTNHKVSNELIKMFSSISPEVFKNHVQAVSDIILNKKTEVDISFLQSFHHLLKRFPDKFPEDSRLREQLQDLALNGSPLQAKYAVKISGFSADKKLIISNIIEKIMPLDINHAAFTTRLSSVAEIYLIDHNPLDQYSTAINSLIADDILRCNRMSENDYKTYASESWVSDEHLYETRNHLLLEKLLALRLISNRIRAIAESNSLSILVDKPLRLLITIVSNSGEIVKSSQGFPPTPVPFQQRLRLFAGTSLLKLAKLPQLDLVINFSVIAKLERLIIDDCKNVRERFLKSLQKYLSRNAVSERFLHLVFLVGHDPDTSLKNNVLTWVRSLHSRYESKSETTFERVIVRLIHSISHDERFEKSISVHDEIQMNVEKAYIYCLSFLSFYLEGIAKEKNVSLLYYFASRVKQYRDSQVNQELYRLENVPDQAMNLYRVAELCQLMIKELADSKNWNLQTYPGKMQLPSDIFSPIGDYQEAQRTISKIYIPDEVQVALLQHLRKIMGSHYTKRTASVRKATAKKPRTNNGKRKQVRRKQPLGGATDNEKDDVPVPIRRSKRATTKVQYQESSDISSEEEEIPGEI